MNDFLFRGDLSELDADVNDLVQAEEHRQVNKLILIPSESQAPWAVRQALSSVYQNLYAEGYPDDESRTMSEAEILNYPERIGHFHRYSDPRYYKGVEYADLVEALAKRRVAEVFATSRVSMDDIFVNVQALSGAPANNAVYHALINPGDTIMGMALPHGGHLTHGAPANRSGKLYKSVPYSVNPTTEQLDYDQIESLALQHKPKVIIAGYSSYPWMVNWAKFQKIAKSVGAYLLADISHVAGLVAAGVYNSPIGYADVVTFTTHKSLCGPRGACILSTNAALAKKIDRAVFPGEQGGPHVHAIAAIAVTMKLAQTEQFKALQKQIVENCRVFTDRLKESGFRIPFGGTDTHLMNLDCSTIIGPDGTSLSGDQAARILDIAGIVVNRNTIPGDLSAFDPSGIRMGTPWVTQRGFKESQMIELADTIAFLLKHIIPYSLEGRKGEVRRAKVDFEALEQTKLNVRKLVEKAGSDLHLAAHAILPESYLNQKAAGKWTVLSLSGEDVRQFLNFALSSDLESLNQGDSQECSLVTPLAEIHGTITWVSTSEYALTIPSGSLGLVENWLRDLSDGYVLIDDDLWRKQPGPVVIRREASAKPVIPEGKSKGITAAKPYFIGIEALSGENLPVTGNELPGFQWEAVGETLHRTPLYETHKRLGAKIIPFAGWEMPVWYSSVVEEHLAVRQAAGIFDVSHMGVYQAEGLDAVNFLNCVTGNDIGSLGVGESCYTHFLDPDAQVIDDLLVYRRSRERFMIVVNAANDDKDWAWLNAVKNSEVLVDRRRPASRAFGRGVILRNLRDPKEGADMRVDIALQGPHSRDILLALGADERTRKEILSLKRTGLCEANLGGFNLVVSRTGYTGEKMAFELFVHPESADALFTKLLEGGAASGLKPIGLGARDSLRTEAGLPLYGHEMGIGSGKLQKQDLGVAEAGFGSYVKIYKPWFIGREAYIAQIQAQMSEVVRFRFNEKGVRMAHSGDPVLEKRGKVIGFVTSCAVDQEGYLTGQAYLDLHFGAEGTPVYIYQGASDKGTKAANELRINEKVILPTPATVLSRFMK
jgi:glycine hydroxymethyltransferase